MTIDEAADAIQDQVEIVGQKGEILAILARMQAHRDELFRRIRRHEREANSARWSEARAKSGFGAKQARARAQQHERAVEVLEVELGLRKGRSNG